MATFDDVARLVTELPEVIEGTSYGRRAWKIGRVGFAWERPLSKADLKRFGDRTPPSGPLLGLRTEDLHEKESLLAEGRRGVFTIPHFDNYPAVLLQLDAVGEDEVRTALLDAWLACAPPALARAYLDGPS